MAWYSQTWTFFDGDWREGNPALMGPRSHAFWLGSSVFDGARVFEGVMPDMDRHAERVNRSAEKIGLKPTVSAEAIVELTRDGAKKFAKGSALYVRPMVLGGSRRALDGVVRPGVDPLCALLYEAAMPQPAGFSVMKSSYRRPTLESMPTDSKAGCLYPNSARALREANAKGFGNALVCDMLGNVAETATSNIFLVKAGVVKTPAPNGTFLNGITRQRVIALLRAAGVAVQETTLRHEDFLEADEIFSSGNYSKVVPVIRIDHRDLQPGPVFRKARELYWDFAHSRLAEAA